MTHVIDVVTAGEGLIVFDPAHTGPLRHVHTFTKRVGGAEVNVATGLARLGLRVGFLGRVGQDEFGEQVSSFLRGEGVDVTGLRRDPGANTGMYVKEWSAPEQLTVRFYRDDCAGSRFTPEDVDLDLVRRARLLHLTGISVALSDSSAAAVEAMADAAEEAGVPLSFDVNIRRRLLRDRDPSKLLGALAARADVLFLSDAEAEVLTGSSVPEAVAEYRSTIRASVVVVHTEAGAYAVHEGGVVLADGHRVRVVDPVGAGDAFAAGFLASRLGGRSLRRCLESANAAGACAVTVPGDAESAPTAEAVARLLDGADHVER
ncbi:MULTISPECIES: sugar kinase [Actinoalloteichus]|uniref:Sugar kinase, ribokinase n=1 Tax=Actinoalloteichus fjordicus TaxID=1612552 RepID=A0AAC9PT39_9PSEU|nr:MULTISPECIES: sugar kinase [Actinoalloteichus]APU16249.1 sugar kinase, ribokinase [Actinoalloteichus fjordicus]APU22309.1 sugar kinase, ribokinase [Actinoalloteichus sp. GBA129-24]